MLFGPLIDLLVPPSCEGCARPLPGGGGPLCGGCRRALAFLPAGTVCPRCALPAPCGRGGARGRCPAAGARWRTAWAPVAYTAPATDLVHALKFRGALWCADLMAAQIAAGAPDGLLTAEVTLVPVPTDPARRRGRGFDQADVIARALATRTGLPVRACLRRDDRGARQLGAGRSERLRDGRLRVHCRGPAPTMAVLIDDVHTTGATLRASAATLRAAGTDDVVALTWARTL